MEHKLLEELTKKIKNGAKAALAIITKISGSTPRIEGSMMIISEDGTIQGTIGGGIFESKIISEAKKCMAEGKNKSYHFKLNDDEGSLHMQCGGEAEVFIKVFNTQSRLLIVGGGHISLKLYLLGKMLGYYTVIFDDREEFCNHDRFPEADELQFGDIKEKLRNYSIDSNSYIVIVTRGHENDEIALKEVLNRGACYIGMIGSIQKTNYIMNNMIKEGYDKDVLEKVYAPIGLELGGETPEDIALSIMAEIQIIKNQGKLRHMKRSFVIS
ncbi:XdhC family protein [Paramaledivibacter caminithermalis]|uniref:Xanthine dehydrogenase accessory factor n=1 Tax=Paramaledivibacter caminithermalis (strain DSM 15212 / CIP 107654 / DViRD3) TaxID=1121301 RepID=A0A1M6K8T6_PARC5|nr:XdhC/CoxI family protein [Paramaledivibacter caminithermalis]SHJ55408.1 xanthine dehydrogenase accessory factor [Paramaledivibacter caminithermalis DSM 15212]